MSPYLHSDEEESLKALVAAWATDVKKRERDSE